MPSQSEGLQEVNYVTYYHRVLKIIIIIIIIIKKNDNKIFFFYSSYKCAAPSLYVAAPISCSLLPYPPIPPTYQDMEDVFVA
jgi:hypothetical protein